METNVKLNAKSIIDILTLRYDSTQKPLLPKLSSDDFLPTNYNPSIEYIQKTLEDQIKNKIKSDEDKVAVALSGGVDSTLVLSALRNAIPNQVEAISIKFADSVDETPAASKIANELQVNHNVVFVENYLAELPKAISIIGLPFWDLHWYYVTKKAKTLSKYLVSGDGGDELFGGYTFRYKKFLSLVTSDSNPLDKIKAYLQCHERDRVPNQDELFGKKVNFSWDLIYKQLLQYFDNNLPLLEQVFLADYNGKLLYNFLPVNTSLHNHFGVVAVAPILSKEMIQYATHIPSSFKYDLATDTGKLLLRKLLTKYKTDNLVSTEKLGFNVNTLNLWKNFGQKICKKYLSNARVVQDGWINQSWIDSYIDKRDDLEIRYVNKLMGLLGFEIWYRLFFTKEMSPDTILN
ncbi:MAG: asparagine synthase C-terminal domain-containing protein [Thermoproteota archaeon]